jgi:aminotransferase
MTARRSPQTETPTVLGPRMSGYLSRLPEYPSKAIASIAKRSPGSVNLAIGEPWFGPPPLIETELAELSADATARGRLREYVHSHGGASLRSAIADRLAACGVPASPEANVAVTSGASHAFMLAVLGATEHGDEIIIPDPSYMLYQPVCEMLGRVARRCRTTEGFGLDLDAVRERVTARTRMIVVNSPCNPTGWLADAEDLSGLLDLGRRAGIWILHDEVYDDFTFDGARHVSVLELDPEFTVGIQINSLSKRYGVPGLRIGWIAARHELITCCVRALEHLTLSVSYIGDSLASALMRDATTGRWLRERRDDLQARRDLALVALREIVGPGRLVAPMGGLFVFLNVSDAGARLEGSDHRDAGAAVATHLAASHGLAVVPGSVYGERGADFIRLVFAVPEDVLREGLARLSRALG